MACHSQTSLPGTEQPCRLHHDDYTVAIICPMGDEMSPVLALLDQSHKTLSTSRNQNAYKLGKMGHHNVVIAGMPEIGNNAAAMVVTQLLNDFSRIRFGLLVGIGGGIPDEDYEDDDLNDMRLGDVVVSHSRGTYGGVIQFDRGKSTTDGFVVTGHHSKPPHVLAANVEILKASHNLHGNGISRYLDEMLDRHPRMRDRYSLPGSERDCVFEASYTHEGGKTCKNCDISRTIKRPERRTDGPRIHYGIIGSSNTVIKDSHKRNKLRDMGILCVEMEAAGLMEAFPCLVIRGISDYADSHKNKKWQPYAAATAAAYSKELLLQIPKGEVQRTQSVINALEGLSMRVDGLDEKTRVLVEQTQSQAEMMVLEWLSSKDVNFSRLQNESQQTHTLGTGQWLLDHRSYQNWRDHEPGLLWLHGVAGCGKTILCSTIIRDLQRNLFPLAYWYFQFDNQTAQNMSQMLRSIIRQLSSSPLPEEIHSLFNRHSQRASEPSLEELITALNHTIDRIAQDVYIVFDALDECPHKDKKGQRHELLHCVKSLNRTHSKLHLLVTSRPEPDIQIDLRPVSSCDLDIEEPIRSDVERFVKVTLEDPRLASWTEGVRDRITKKLLEYKERRFRWADLQIKRFAQCPNIEQLEIAMDSVPKDLEAAYRQAFDAIDDGNTAHVAKIMMWLAFSLEPLAADQIAAIAGFRNPDYVLQICSTLLVTIIDEDTTKIIKLAHFSVKEFLVLKTYETSTQWYRFTMEHANRSIALFTLEGLLQPQHQMKNILSYAARYWPQHALEGLKIDNQMELKKQICLLFSDKCRAHFLGWLKMHDPDNINGFQSRRAAQPLYYASLLGFQSVVCSIWTDDTRLSRNEGRYGNALNAAAISGNVAVVGWILRNCSSAANFLDLVRVAGEINANVTECIVEICNGPTDLKITEDVVQAAAENESSGRQVMKALLDNRGDEVQITENIISTAAGNWESGQQVVELLLKHRREEVQITEEVVKAAFANQYSGRQILKTILEYRGNEPQITESMIRTAMKNGESGQQVMELLLEERKKENETYLTQEIASLVFGNFNTSAARLLLEKRGEQIPMTEQIITAAAKSHLYGPQMIEMLLGMRHDDIQLTKGVVLAAANNSTSGQQVLEVLLRKATYKSPVTSSVVSLIAERFDAHIMELFLIKNMDDISLTEEVLKSVASNEANGKQVLEVLLSKKGEKVHQITESVVRAAATNNRSGQQVMELFLSERADTVQISDKVFMLVACRWDGERLMKLLSESIEDDEIDDVLVIAQNTKNKAAVRALGNRIDHPTTILNEAISRRDGVAAELLLKSSAQHMNKRWRYSLRLAAFNGLTGVVELLLNIGVDQTASGRDGKTPLMYAVQWKYPDTAELLLKHGADLAAKDRYGHTPLTLACTLGRLLSIDLLLQMGADPTVGTNDGSTPLMIASKFGIADIVELLLTHGADHNMQDNNGNRSLDYATENDHVEIVDLLLRRGANPLGSNSNGFTPLMLASEKGFLKTAGLLLQNGADLTMTDKHGRTALLYAAFAGRPKVAYLLIKYGADLGVADEHGYTALHKASLNGHMEVAHLLIRFGADMELLEGHGCTALHCASSTGNYGMVLLLLQRGAKIAAKDMNGRTALHHGSYHGQAEVVRTLIQYGADIRVKDKSGCIPLYWALGKGHTKVVEILASKDPRHIHQQSLRGPSASETATKIGHNDIVRLLTEKSTETNTFTGSSLRHETRLNKPGDMLFSITLKPDDVHGAQKVSRAFEKFKSFWSRP